MQFQVTTELVQSKEAGRVVGWIDAKRFSEVRDAYPDTQAFKVIKVHECTDAIQSEFLRGNAIGIYTFRDIRDVYVSMMRQRLKSFADIWQEGFLEACLDNYKKWTELPNVLVSKYEEIMSDLSHEVCRIASHLSISLPATASEAIANNYSLDVQQARIEQFKEKLLQTPLNPDDHRQMVDYHDEKTLLHMNHIDSAKVGRWRNDLTDLEIAHIEEKVREWCDRFGYTPSTFLRT
ncbi:sulfotransferase domain-containing protein [Oscillatoria sp. FACHB-1407]|uniref:sulfotransferase domain-containing protein n=1 Tax=Oscillatoria sp. FACHB-1407 TaxID=2692847 RepID=UPI0018EF67F3|nr:sulfotransferase domain-containing protein [Oscillatoria sp. FACHB-1407]